MVNVVVVGVMVVLVQHTSLSAGHSCALGGGAQGTSVHWPFTNADYKLQSFCEQRLGRINQHLSQTKYRLVFHGQTKIFLV